MISQCAMCARLRKQRRAGDDATPRCDAFPNGIPQEVFWNTLDHAVPIEGDNGKHFVFDQEYENEMNTMEGRQP